MQRSSWIVRFLVWFVPAYLLLAIPWPGWGPIYRRCFIAGASAIFRNDARRELSFESPGPEHVRIVIVNRERMQPDGSGPVRNLEIDVMTFWMPAALLVALTIATPVPWWRRVRALVLGLVILHVVLFALLGFCIWNDSTEVGLVVLTPFWKSVADGLARLVNGQMGLAIPGLIWAVAVLRREDKGDDPALRSAG